MTWTCGVSRAGTADLVRVVVDLTRCQGYGQCVFLAPEVFRMREEVLLYDLEPPADQREHLLRAAAACPVQAIHLDSVAASEPGESTYTGRIVIVGGSLAGARAAETLRREGFAGPLTVISEEEGEPYDRPPLSKQVLTGQVTPEHTRLPRIREIDAEWLAGTPATGLDVAAQRVLLGDGREVPFDRVLLATGTRARPWPNEAEAALKGVPHPALGPATRAACARRWRPGRNGC